MFKKTLISLAVASSLGLSGCFDDGDTGRNADPEPKINNPEFTGKTWPLFNPVTSELPVPSDLQFAQGAGADGTLGGPEGDEEPNPITTALDFMDGSSTIAQFDIRLSGAIDKSTVNASPVISTENGLAPNPQQNVFLLSLNFPGGDSLINGSAFYTNKIAELVASGDIDPANVLDRPSFPGETPTFDLGIAFSQLQAAAGTGNQQAIAAAAGAVLDFNNEFRAEVVSLNGGTDNVLRITPLRPLKDKTKYLVVVTDEVKDSVGQSLVASPSYQSIEDPEQPLGSAALAPVRGAIQTWERLASGYFGALTNNSRAAAGLPALDADDIALSLTFTTGGTTDVLEAATSPAQFFFKSAETSTRQEAIAKYLASNADNFEALTAPQQFGTLAQVAQTAVAQANAQAPTLKQTAAGTAAAIAGAPGSDLISAAPRSITPIAATRIPAAAALGASANPGTIFQAGIQLPYYLQVPTEQNPSALNATWQASPTVGAIIDSARGNEQGTTPPSDKITFRFPFPAQNDTVFAPLMISAPDAAACADAKPYDVVIYQHGIFGNRSHSLALGNQLAGSCFVTVAMDLPMHGIAPKLATGSLDPSLPFSVDVSLNPQTGEFVESPLPMNERHFGWGQTQNRTPTRMQYSTNAEEAVGSSAQFFLNLTNLPAARDNNRQGVVDLLNLNASLENLNPLDIDGNGTAGDDVNITDGLAANTSKVYFVGHSLGGILGTSFVALANNAAQESVIGNGNVVPFTAAALVTPGAGIAKLLENSPSLGSTILGGLAAGGLTQGTSNLELYFNVAQASLDSAEPHNFVAPLLASDIPVYINEIYGNGSDRSTQDQTIPIAADTAYAGAYTAPRGAALPAPLAGTEPLIMQLEADTITGSGAAGQANAVRFTAGTHTTIISPDQDSQSQLAVFGDMATNIVSFFVQDGAAIQFNNAAFVKQAAPTPENP
jgi:hypothetical protein